MSVTSAVESERSSRPPNAFLGFLEQNSETFNDYTNLVGEIRVERTGWRNSLSFRSLADTYAEAHVLGVLPSHRIRDSRIDKLIGRATVQSRNFLTSYTFGSGSEVEEEPTKTISDLELRRGTLFGKRLPADFQSRWEQWIVEYGEFFNDYEESIRPLVAVLRDREQELLGNLGIFLNQDYRNFEDATVFFSEPQYHARREGIRPFLVKLAELEFKPIGEKRSILEQARRFWLENFEGNPAGPLFDQFYQQKVPDLGVGDITQEGNKFIMNGDYPDIVQWLAFTRLLMTHFAKRPSNPLEIDELIDEEIKMAISQIGVESWPKKLRNEYTALITKEVTRTYEQARGTLRAYFKNNPLPTVDIPEEEVIRKKRDKNIDRQKPPPILTAQPVQPEENLYLICQPERNIGQKRLIPTFLSEEEVDQWVNARAGEFAHGDPKLEADMSTMLVSIRQEPFGFGTRKLTGKSIGVDMTRFPLRSFAPNRRHSIHMQHELSNRLRVVYAIYPNNGNPAIVLEGVYKHEDYDKKFGS